jgi:cryptochrome
MSGYDSEPREKQVVHWFRKGLRLHDNPSLKDGLKGCSTYRCIFILDPWFAGSSNVDINKWRYNKNSATK